MEPCRLGSAYITPDEAAEMSPDSEFVVSIFGLLDVDSKEVLLDTVDPHRLIYGPQIVMFGTLFVLTDALVILWMLGVCCLVYTAVFT